MLAPGFCGAAFRALAWIGSETWGYAWLHPRLSPAALSEPVVYGRSLGAGLCPATLSEPGCGVIGPKYKHVSAYEPEPLHSVGKSTMPHTASAPICERAARAYNSTQRFGRGIGPVHDAIQEMSKHPRGSSRVVRRHPGSFRSGRAMDTGAFFLNHRRMAIGLASRCWLNLLRPDRARRVAEVYPGRCPGLICQHAVGVPDSGQTEPLLASGLSSFPLSSHAVD